MAEQVAPMACSPLHGNEETVPPAEAPAEEPSAEDPPPEEPSAEDPPPEEPPAKETVPLKTEVLPKAEETAEEKQERHEARAKAIKERQDQLKAEIIRGIEARMENTETNRMGKEGHRPGEDAVQPPVAPPEEQEPGPAAKDGRLPFNVFGSEAATPAAPGAELKVKEEAEDSDQEGEPALVVQDLQGLCINIYCKLYYMGRADCDRRLCARGKLNEGRKWSPKEWVDSGSYAQVEEQLLKDSFDEAMKEVEGLPPPVKSIPLPAKALVESGPIIIEDMETGEVLNPESSGSKPDAAPENDEASMEKALLAATRRVRNKGWKRVQALAEKISEKKARGEWKGPNIPLPKEAYEHLQSAAFKIQDKVDPNKDWKYDDWKKW